MKRPPLHRYATRPGFFPTPDGGADAVIWSENAERVWFCVVEDASGPSALQADAVTADDATPLFEFAARHRVTTRVVTHDSGAYRETLFAMNGPNYGRWFVHLPHAWSGMRYGYRTDGPWDPKNGLRFNPYKFLIDPCSKGLEGHVEYSEALFAYDCELDERRGTVYGNAFGQMSTRDSLGSVPFSVVIDDSDTAKHAADPEHPHIPWSSTVLYELHVKGFTQQAPWLPAELRGTYAGLADPHTISYLKGLGITSVELLPIFAKQTEPSVQARGKTNYWGYSTLNYFTAEPSYATSAAQEAGPVAVRQEVIEMVRGLHEAGIEVILDVVYNHSCEGGVDGYSLCWRGIDAHSYYRREPDNPGRLIDTTGTGNTFDFMNTHVITGAVDSLRYWAKRIGVDGFRFDLAASLGRLEYDFTPHHPFFYAIRADQLLGNLKLIMEPWDLGGGGWRTGQFGLPFSEWNDHFRDSSRKFWLTDAAKLRASRPAEVGMQEMATRLCGSSDLFATQPGRGAVASINYICSHDGFTAADLTRYNAKHNDANGEDNEDGTSLNNSYNCGIEGPTDDPGVILKRQRAVLNFMGTLLLSMGTPMICAGDEFGRTQRGNNNAYCQDNDISWIDWSWMESEELGWQRQRYESVKDLIAVRNRLEQFHHDAFFTVTSRLGLLKQSNRIQWYLADGTTPSESDWFDRGQRSFMMRLRSHDQDALVSINGLTSEIPFSLPSDARWNLLWSSQPVDLSAQEHREAAQPQPVAIPQLTISLWEQKE
ncbi:MAG: glycogen debranching protein GlgX [Bifidobacteriaceae bacterium]|jgi:glycogen operon protein|nr:glycogen debranching protein GlgX [Bifidobacteriaceae bacterium]MCI1914591.1 glycogen debranching protein GlgX [Bifidobacteriaceae bacterium]